MATITFRTDEKLKKEAQSVSLSIRNRSKQADICAHISNSLP